jgi:hypothetical protein
VHVCVYLLSLLGTGSVNCFPLFIARQRFGNHVPAAMNTRNNKRIVGHMCLWVFLCIPLLLLGNGSVKTLLRQRRNVGGVVFYAGQVVSKELPRTSYLVVWNVPNSNTIDQTRCLRRYDAFVLNKIYYIFRHRSHPLVTSDIWRALKKVLLTCIWTCSRHESIPVSYLINDTTKITATDCKNGIQFLTQILIYFCLLLLEVGTVKSLQR